MGRREAGRRPCSSAVHPRGRDQHERDCAHRTPRARRRLATRVPARRDRVVHGCSGRLLHAAQAQTARAPRWSARGRVGAERRARGHRRRVAQLAPPTDEPGDRHRVGALRAGRRRSDRFRRGLARSPGAAPAGVAGVRPVPAVSTGARRRRVRDGSTGARVWIPCGVRGGPAARQLAAATPAGDTKLR